MKLIIDCGSTKADLACVSYDLIPRYRQAKGINVALCASTDDVINYFMLLPWVSEASEIYFYGAGCRPGQIGQRTATAIAMASRARVVEAHSDMLGAARAVLGHSAGVTCILGTGSNSCLFNGMEITDNIPSLGYVLGDEGSSNDLGRRLLSDMYKRQLSEEFCSRFAENYPAVNVETVIENVYRRPGANAWLGQMARFLSANIDLEDSQRIVTDALDSFVRRNVLPYGSKALEEPIGFVGSVACEFRPQLEAVMAAHGLSIGHVLRRPVDGLVGYHSAGISPDIAL